MASDVERFKAACMAVDENVPPCATEKQLSAFEQKHGVRLTMDTRTFYGFMNGAGPDYEYVFTFWPLDEIRPTTVDGQSGWFIFADHSVSVFEYAIKLTADGPGPSDVYCPELERTVAASFSDFLRRCLDDPASLW
jgi:hypothetical protein